MNIKEYIDTQMPDWVNEMGKHFLNEGALSYIVSDENPISWDGEEERKQKIDMVIFFKEYVNIIELKQTDALHRKGIKFKQIERYYQLQNNTTYTIRFWVYVYWIRYKTIVGVLMTEKENLQFYAIDKDNGINFYASIGSDPTTRIRKDVDFKLVLNNE